MKLINILIFAFALCAIVQPAQAQEYNRALEMITQLNKIDPQQNPGLDSADEILKRRVLDQKNKVVGDVLDIVIKDNGSITAMQVDFNRLRLGPEVFLNYRDMNARPTTNGYSLGFNDEQLTTLYPTFLSNIEAAAGSEEEAYSVRKLLGTQVKAEDGRKIGLVEDVLFAANGGRVEAFLVSMQINNLRGRELAVPIDMAKIETSTFGRSLVVRDIQADAMIDYADDDR